MNRAQASWIWAEGPPARNEWVAFRSEWTLESAAAGRLRIACADKYWLWINSSLVVREGGLKSGPSRTQWYVDELELAGWASPEGNLWGAVPTSRFAGGFREFPAQTLLLIGFGLKAYWLHGEDRSLLASFYPAMRKYLLELYHLEQGVVLHRGPWETAWQEGVQCWYDWGTNADAEALDFAEYRIPTVHGVLQLGFHRRADGTRFHLRIPPNVTVRLPGCDPEKTFGEGEWTLEAEGPASPQNGSRNG